MFWIDSQRLAFSNVRNGWKADVRPLGGMLFRLVHHDAKRRPTEWEQTPVRTVDGFPASTVTNLKQSASKARHRYPSFTRWKADIPLASGWVRIPTYPASLDPRALSGRPE